MEWLLGLTAGLFVLAGGLSAMATLVTAGSRLQLDARLQHELAQAAGLMAREIRRAGSWSDALAATLPGPAGTTPVANPHDIIAATPSGADAPGHIAYSLSRDAAAGRPAGGGTLDGDEQFGFRVNAGTLQMQVGSGVWQPLTDPGLVRITHLQVSSQERRWRIDGACERPCCEAGEPSACVPNVPNPPGCPRITERAYTLLLMGQTHAGSSPTRAVREHVNVRNSRPSGVCPP